PLSLREVLTPWPPLPAGGPHPPSPSPFGRGGTTSDPRAPPAGLVRGGRARRLGSGREPHGNRRLRGILHGRYHRPVGPADRGRRPRAPRPAAGRRSRNPR